MNEREESTRDPALSGLYRQAAPAEPPAALDAVILAAARQAVQPAPVRRTSWWKKWSTPLTVMATVVMAVMLTLTVDRQPKDLPAPASMPLPASAWPNSSSRSSWAVIAIRASSRRAWSASKAIFCAPESATTS